MVRWRAGVVVAVVVGVVACSSDDEDSCEIAGLYTATGTLESGDCPVPTDPVTDTFEVKGDEATLTIQGVQGGCTGKIAGCKWTASCQTRVLDALDPNDDQGTVQYSWTFSKTGFTGTSAISVPPAVSLPKGCRAIARVTGTRR